MHVAAITVDLNLQIGQGKIADGIRQAAADINYLLDAGWATRNPPQASIADIKRRSEKQSSLRWIPYPLLALIFDGIGAT